MGSYLQILKESKIFEQSIRNFFNSVIWHVPTTNNTIWNLFFISIYFKHNIYNTPLILSFHSILSIAKYLLKVIPCRSLLSPFHTKFPEDWHFCGIMKAGVIQYPSVILQDILRIFKYNEYTERTCQFGILTNTSVEKSFGINLEEYS